MVTTGGVLGTVRRIGILVLRHVHRRRRILATLSTILLTALAFATAYWVRFDLSWPAVHTQTMLLAVGPLIILRLITSRLFHLNAHLWRYTGTLDMVEVLLATGASSLLFFGLVSLVPMSPPVPKSVILLELMLANYFMGGTRITYRMGYEWLTRSRRRRHEDVERVLIVGAGKAGHLLIKAIHNSPDSRFNVVGFVDDDVAKRGSRLHGVPVLGTTESIPVLAIDQDLDCLILAVPGAEPEDLSRIVGLCEETDLKLSILPREEDVLAGHVHLSSLRDVQIEDLLARDPIRLELPELADDIAGKSVLITGAAGSIGSELARQVAMHGPSVLVLFDQAETPLFFLDMELRADHPDVSIIPVVGDILDEDRLAKVIGQYVPTRIFHAAAYKHVPMMETNQSEAIKNNVLGTLNVALAAGRYGVDKFVLISTDKAVNASSVMGESKRLAELVILSCTKRFPNTMYTAVRFGNVMGSQGSVIPIFRRQLAANQPLTVTHTDVTRYFMTIPEAVQLVLQASLLPESRGHITMLDMGRPVRILDVAQKFLRLAGIKAASERINIIGLRPGEKLHEELTFEQEQTASSGHEKVQIVLCEDDRVCEQEFVSRISELRQQSETEHEMEVLDRISMECLKSVERAGQAQADSARLVIRVV